MFSLIGYAQIVRQSVHLRDPDLVGKVNKKSFRKRLQYMKEIMKVFKFGGASVKDAQAVKNATAIISQYRDEPLLVVISAMGKTTNALEQIWKEKLYEPSQVPDLYPLKSFHYNLVDSLFPAQYKAVVEDLNRWFTNLENILSLKPYSDANHYYDSIISFGELISTSIVAHYLQSQQMNAVFIDARDFILTDNTYREAKVNWDATQQRCQQKLPSILNNDVIITQGFIGRSAEGHTTTLGREGSDFSAAIFAYCLQAESVSIWKDVPGILNADPKLYSSAVKFDELSYQEAAEMTYYGASVIHPKTIKPLANKKIPLWVKSFEYPTERGTVIHDCQMGKLPASIIVKPNQCLITMKVLDFTFINEHHLSLIFKTLDECNIKINMMQNTAISFSIAIDNQDYKIEVLLDKLKDDFKILYNQPLQLITIKNYDTATMEMVMQHKTVFVEQRSRSNYQAIVQ